MTYPIFSISPLIQQQHGTTKNCQAIFNKICTSRQKTETFALEEYSVALLRGDKLSKEKQGEIIQKLARCTGLLPDYIERAQLRVNPWQFRKELLRNDKRTIGRFDIRFLGIDSDTCGEFAEYDPSFEALAGILTAVFNEYARSELKLQKDEEYRVIIPLKGWNYSKATNQYLNLSPTLAEVMSKNPNFRVMVANGYYDLALPYFGSDYSFNHLGYDISFQDRVTRKYYEAGHMMYTYRPSLIQLKQDIAAFIEGNKNP